MGIMERSNQSPSTSSGGSQCWDDVSPVAASSPSSNSEEGLLRTKRQRRAPKPFEPEPDPKRRRATNSNKQPVRDLDGRFIKRTASPRKRAPVSTSPSAVSPARDSKGRFFNAEGDACNVFKCVPPGLVMPSTLIGAYSSHSSEPFAQNFLDSILNFPD